MSESKSQKPPEPISAVGVVSSLHVAQEDYFVVAQTTDGSDADLWKDGLFKSKVTRYLCFTRKTGPEVVVDMKLIDIKDALPEGFTPVEETMDTKETAIRKRRLCVRMSPRADADTAVCDIQITAKSKFPLINYTCMGEINNMGLWYRSGEVLKKKSAQMTTKTAIQEPLYRTVRRTTSKPHYEQQGSGIYTISALDDVPFMISEKFSERKPIEMQQVNLMGITIKSLAEIEEEFQYNFSAERSIAV